jgi:antitoxin (DNA-binding transcriptional repressor) of toxin-antitoxin stability system
MSAITMDVTEFATKVKEVIANLKRDEEIIITGDNNQALARLTPVNEQTKEEPEAKPKRRRLGLSDSIIWISPDFDEPLEDFKEYMP